MIEQYIEERHKDDPDLIPGVSTTPPEFHFIFCQGIKFGHVILLGKSRCVKINLLTSGHAIQIEV